MGRPSEGDTVIKASELAKLLGVSGRSLTRFAEEGKVHRADGRGLYYRDASVRAYVDHLRAIAAGRGDTAVGIDLTGERAREAKERADKLAIANAKERAELVPVATVTSLWTSIATAVRRRLLTVPPTMRNSGLSAADTERLDLTLRAILNDLADTMGAGHDA